MKSPEPAVPSHQSFPELRRELSLLDSTMVNVGSMIGSGIFIVPSTIALVLHDTSSILFVWTLAGVVSLFGTLAVAELGALMPRAGGQFVYLHEIYGPLWGFLYGWTAFTVIISASISAIAVGFASYVGFFVPLSPAEIKLVAIASIVLLTLVNSFGVKFGVVVQNGFTFLKIASFALLLGFSFFLGGGSLRNLSPLTPIVPLSGLIAPMGIAMVSVLWAYDGWIEITFVAGEVRNPERNLHRSLIISTLLVIALYILINLAYIYVLSLDRMSRSSLVASDAATVTMGPIGASFVALAVMISTFGANNGFVFTGARIYYAMAKSGLFFRPFGNVHPNLQTPIVSLAGQGVWASVLVLTGTYNELIAHVVFASWISYAMSCAGVFILRKRDPDRPRPYKAWGYPYSLIVFLFFAAYLVVNTLVQDPVGSSLGLAVIAAGIPAYYYWKRKQGGGK